jgi:hypothetical protein
MDKDKRLKTNRELSIELLVANDKRKSFLRVFCKYSFHGLTDGRRFLSFGSRDLLFLYIFFIRFLLVFGIKSSLSS